MSSEYHEFLSRLRAAALRARASGFTATADAIEAIIRDERARLENEAMAPRSPSNVSKPSSDAQ